jgi:dUTP pyrophosphatase
MKIWPGQRVAVPTGFAIAVPFGMVELIWSRSGLTVKKGLDSLGSAIDADCRDEATALLIDQGDAPIEIQYGERIAQLVIVPCYRSHMREVDELPDTERGLAGFGSTGLS